MLIHWLFENVNHYLQHAENQLPIIDVQALQKEREEKLITILKNRLEMFIDGQTDEFESWANSEAQRLSRAGILFLTCLMELYNQLKWGILELVVSTKTDCYYEFKPHKHP